MIDSRRTRTEGVLSRLLGARVYVPLSLVCSLVLLAGIAVNLLMRAGQWPPTLIRAQDNVAITGPGVSTPVPLQAYVLGAVCSPGVYALAPGARIHDLIAAAGGALPSADLTRVHLAAVVGDGESVYVPHVGEVIPTERGGKIDLNTASAEQMHLALGITLTTARKIVAYRTAHGGFAAVSQLLLVPISRTIYDRIKIRSSQSIAVRFPVLC